MKIFNAVDFRSGEKILRRNVNFATDNRLDAALFGGLVEIDNAVHCAVVGYRQTRHAEIFCRVEQVADSRRPVKQAVFGVNVQMREV